MRAHGVHLQLAKNRKQAEIRQMIGKPFIGLMSFDLYCDIQLAGSEFRIKKIPHPAVIHSSDCYCGGNHVRNVLWTHFKPCTI